jgi:hypothetical protein
MCDAERKEGEDGWEGEAEAELDLWRATRGGFERRRTGEWWFHSNTEIATGQLPGWDLGKECRQVLLRTSLGPLVRQSPL